MFRLQFGHTATKIVAPIAAAAALFAGSVNAPAQAVSSFGTFNPAAFGFTVPAAAGLPAGGENVLQAWSDYSDARIVQLWMDSPGHRKNLLDPRAKSVGIGMAIGADGKLYAVQNFGR